MRVKIAYNDTLETFEVSETATVMQLFGMACAHFRPAYEAVALALFTRDGREVNKYKSVWRAIGFDELRDGLVLRAAVTAAENLEV